MIRNWHCLILTENSLFIPSSLHQPIPRNECDMYDGAVISGPKDKDIPCIFACCQREFGMRCAFARLARQKSPVLAFPGTTPRGVTLFTAHEHLSRTFLKNPRG